MEVEAPTIASMANAEHDHRDSEGGGNLQFWREIDTGEGTYDDGAVIYQVPTVLSHTMPANFVGSAFYCTAAPADGDVVITVKQGGSSVGTLTFTMGQDINDPAVMVSAGYNATVPGKFQLVNQATTDSNFAGLHGAMLGTR